MTWPLRTVLTLPQAVGVALEVGVVVAEVRRGVELVDGCTAGLAEEEPGDRAVLDRPHRSIARGQDVDGFVTSRATPLVRELAGQLARGHAFYGDEQVAILESGGTRGHRAHDVPRVRPATDLAAGTIARPAVAVWPFGFDSPGAGIGDPRTASTAAWRVHGGTIQWYCQRVVATKQRPAEESAAGPGRERAQVAPPVPGTGR